MANEQVYLCLKEVVGKDDYGLVQTILARLQLWTHLLNMRREKVQIYLNTEKKNIKNVNKKV